MTVSLLKGLGAFCRSCGPSGRPINSRARASSLPLAGSAKVVGQEEEVAEVDAAAAVEVEAGVAAAEGVCEEEEVGEAGLAVAVEVGRGFRGGGEGHRIEAGHRYSDGVGPGKLPRVRVLTARPLAPVETVVSERVPPPAVTANVTVAPAKAAPV